MKVTILASAASLVLLTSTARAQTSAQVFDYKASTNACLVDSSNPAGSNSSCAGGLVGGSGSASGVGDRVARTASSAGNLTQTGGTNSLAAVEEGRGYVYSNFTLNGMSSLAQQTKVVFHFDLTESLSAIPGASTPAFDYGFEGLYLNTALGGAWHYRQTFVNGQSNPFDDGAVTAVTGGYDYAFTNSLSDGSFNYFYETVTENYIHASEQSGTVINTSVAAHLRGIDLTTTGGQVLYSATFDENGAATITTEETSPAPEPATLSLMALGLAGLVLGHKKIARKV